jgi:hypothetical protein
MTKSLITRRYQDATLLAVRGLSNLHLGHEYLAVHLHGPYLPDPNPYADLYTDTDDLYPSAPDSASAATLIGVALLPSHSNESRWQFLLSNAPTYWRHASDAGVLRYSSGYNRHNYLLDLTALADQGIKITGY